MPELNELWDWLAYVRESDAYWIALPSFVGLLLACFTDWMERRLAGDRSTEVEGESDSESWTQFPSSLDACAGGPSAIQLASEPAVPISSVRRNGTPHPRY